jgi:beta-lactamase regulating signal transducer with metallopeptidase domain/biopolymer transport protein ExbD
MILYLLKSGLCLALLLAFYHLVLEREKMHRFNRFYLLGSVLFSFLAPAFIIYVEAIPTFLETVPTSISQSNFNSQEGISPIITPIDESISYITYFFWFYGLISSILLIRFFKSLFHITQKIRKNKKTTHLNAIIVLVNDEILPHTFWNYIFINKIAYEAKEIEEELFTHELTHVTQKHTIDVLLIEALQILFWINPLFFLLKKAVQLNHEFLADDSVIASHNNISEYQYLLLNKAAWKNKYYLASNLNYSLTKKRLEMMKKSNSKATILIKKLAIIPLVTGLIFLFANRVEAQTNVKSPQPEANIQSSLIEEDHIEKTYNGATKAQLKEYEKLVGIYHKNPEVDFLVRLKDMSRIKYIHDLMSDSQKKKATAYPQAPASLAVFVTNDGKYLIDDEEVSLEDIEKLIQQFSSNHLKKSFVFTGKDDTKRYREYNNALRKSTNTKIRALDETYISIFSYENLEKNSTLSIALHKNAKKNGSNKVRVVQHAFKNPKIKTYTIELAKLLDKNGLKNIAY